MVECSWWIEDRNTKQGIIYFQIWNKGNRKTFKGGLKNEIYSKTKEILKFLEENEEDIKKLKSLATDFSNLKIGDSVTIAGIVWSKFAEDENGNSMMLADESVCKMKFGEKNNDWRESDPRKECKRVIKAVEEEIGEDKIVEFETDLFSHDGLKDYGVAFDKCALLTYDLYRNNRENIKELDELWWLSTPDSTPSGYGSGIVHCVGSHGRVGCLWCRGVVAVRPFFVLKS